MKLCSVNEHTTYDNNSVFLNKVSSKKQQLLHLPHHTSNFIKIILFRKRLIYEKISPLIYHQTNRPSKSRGAKKANLQTKTYFLRLKKLQQQPNLIWWRYLHTTFYYNFLQKVKQIFEFILASICHHKIQFYF